MDTHLVTAVGDQVVTGTRKLSGMSLATDESTPT